MKFYHFSTQEERREFGGSCFIEIQFCRLAAATKIEDIVSASRIHYWQNDSLYVDGDEMSQFYEEYSGIFNCGIYNNLESGKFDLYGINYYHPHFIESIASKLRNHQPSDYEVLLAWLEKAKKYNGFYILGI